MYKSPGTWKTLAMTIQRWNRCAWKIAEKVPMVTQKDMLKQETEARKKQQAEHRKSIIRRDKTECRGVGSAENRQEN